MILGKFLGVVVLDVALLTLFAGIVYGVVVLDAPGSCTPPRRSGWRSDNEFYTARASLVPPLIDVQKEVEQLYHRLEANDQLDALYPNYDPRRKSASS